MAIKHAFTSAKADGGDATLIRPSNWNADHDAKQLTAEPDATVLYGLLIEAQAGFYNAYNAFVRMLDENGFQFYNQDVGGIDFVAPAGQGQSHALFGETDTAATGQVSSRGFSFGGIAAQLAFSAGVGLRLHTFTPSEVPVAGYIQLHYDDTNGAAKLKITGKSANGTVVTGEVPLT